MMNWGPCLRTRDVNSAILLASHVPLCFKAPRDRVQNVRNTPRLGLPTKRLKGTGFRITASVALEGVRGETQVV